MPDKLYQDVLNLYVKKAMEVTRADGASIEEMDNNNDVLIYRAASGTLASYIGEKIPHSKSYSGACYDQKKPLIVPFIDPETVSTAALIHKMGIKSMLLVPIIWGEKVLAVFKVSSGIEHHFNEMDAWKMENMAVLAAETLVSIRADATDEMLRQNLELQKSIAEREAKHAAELESHVRFLEGINSVLPCVLYV